MARLAEAVGFDSLWLPDHLLFRFEEVSDQGFWESWTLLAALASSTQRVEIGSLVICSSFRNPALLAKMADTLDEISGGRLILGLGAGYHEPEYRAFGYPYDRRVSRFEEALRIIYSLLRTGTVEFAGRFFPPRQAGECELRPRGPRPAGPPILIGTRGDRMLRLAARYADYWNGWLVNGRNHPDAVPPLRDAVDRACVAEGRDPASLGRTVTLLIDLDGRTTARRIDPLSGDARARPGERIRPLSGTPEEIADALRAFAREGISHSQLWLVPAGSAAVEAFAPVLQLLDRG